MSDPDRKTWQELLEEREGHRPDSLSWLSLRALASSVNHVIALGAPELIEKIRARWVAEVPADGDRIIACPGASKFIVIGDTGEQDASQYVVAPVLAEEASGADPVDFMVICSDVIYPAGANKDYINGFYVPYQDFSKPIYAIPGNHDWYDALGGFMWHFCRQEQPPELELHGVRERIAHRLWRSSPKADLDRLRACRDREGSPIGGQPGPYFAIDTAHVLLVCIDTGVDGTIDAEQGRWLERVSEIGKPKILLTGKPLVVNGKYEPCAITPPRDSKPATRFDTVDDIVRHRAHGYVAAIGGDIHNYQRCSIELEPGDDNNDYSELTYFVSGGGGAFMSATHPVPESEIKEKDVRVGPQPTGTVDCYPDRKTSLIFYAKQLVPRLAEVVFWVAIAVLAIAGAGLTAIHDLLSDDVLRIALAGSAGGAALLTAALWATSRRASHTDHPNSHRTAYRHGVSRLVALLAGIAIGLAGWWLTGDHYARVLGTDAALAAGGWAFAVLWRVTTAWRHLPLQIGGYLFQLVVALAVSCLVAAPPSARPATFAVVLAVTVLLSAFAAVGSWWMQKSVVVTSLPALLAVVSAGLLAYEVRDGGDPAYAAITVVATVAALGMLLVLADQLQRRSPQGYRAQLIVLLALVTAAIAVMPDHRVGQAAVASLTIVAVVVLGVTIAHLGFLYAFTLLVPWHKRSGTLTPAQAKEIVDWRASEGRDRPTDPEAVRVGNLVYPGSRNPHGPIQQKISEIFDRDVPPFYKHFLRVETTENKVTVTRIDVTGNHPRPQPTTCAELPLEPVIAK